MPVEPSVAILEMQHLLEEVQEKLKEAKSDVERQIRRPTLEVPMRQVQVAKELLKRLKQKVEEVKGGVGRDVEELIRVHQKEVEDRQRLLAEARALGLDDVARRSNEAQRALHECAEDEQRVSLVRELEALARESGKVANQTQQLLSQQAQIAEDLQYLTERKGALEAEIARLNTALSSLPAVQDIEVARRACVELAAQIGTLDATIHARLSGLQR